MPDAATLDLLRRLVGFDTVSHKSNLDLIDFCQERLEGLGFRCHRVGNEEGTKSNLVASIGPEGEAGFVLSGHTDVVPVEGQDWSSDPFALRIEGGKAYGRGSADMKGFVALCLAAAPEMAAAKLARPLHLVFSYDEEIGCLGVRGAIAQIKDWAPKPLACFVGEPTGMQVVIGHKSKISLRVEVTGTAGHSSLAPQAVNAVDYGARLAVRIGEIGRRLATEGPFDELYDLPHTTAHVGVFSGGTQLNIVPIAASLDFEFRAIHLDDPHALLAEVERYAHDELEPEMRKVAPGTGFAFHLLSDMPGLATEEAEAVVTLAKQLAGRNDVAKVAYGTEAGLFQTRAEIPTVVCGPGHIAQAHKADEFIALDELDKGAAFISRLIAHASGAHSVA